MFINDSYLTNQLNIIITQAEVLVVEVSNPTVSFTVCAVYRPPDLNVGSFIFEFSDMLSNLNVCKALILAGDFNIDVRNSSKSGVNDYLDMLAGFGIENLITDYTREEHLGNKITKTCIDHVLVRVDCMYIVAGVVRKKLSDHYFTVCVAMLENIAAGNKNDKKEITILDNKNVDKLISEFD